MAAEEKWRPNRDFYLSNPRSTELRGVSLAVIKCLYSLLHVPEIIQDVEKQREIYAELEAHNSRLIELGITPDMQVELDPEVYRQNPVIMAEWVAGQLIPFTGRRIVSEAEVLPMIQEFSEFSVGIKGVIRADVIDGHNLPAKLEDFWDTQMIVAGMDMWLGVVPEEELRGFWWVNRK